MGHRHALDLLNDLSTNRNNFANYKIRSTTRNILIDSSVRSEKITGVCYHLLEKNYTGELEEVLRYLMNRQRHKALEVSTNISCIIKNENYLTYIV